MTEPILCHEGESIRDQDGNPIGRYNVNPLLNCRVKCKYSHRSHL
jgi:hypothetical protein